VVSSTLRPSPALAICGFPTTNLQHDAMTLRPLAYAFDAFAAVGVSILLPSYLAGTVTFEGSIDTFGAKRSAIAAACLGALSYSLAKWVLLQSWRSSSKEKESIYGLQHGRLHLQVPTPMWMNMGYWGPAGSSKTLAEACRDLLKAVLAEAGFSSQIERAEIAKGTRRPKVLIDLGFGCGDQTIYLMAKEPVRPCDREWWDERERCVRFDHYIGITKDRTQARYASERVKELEASGKVVGHTKNEKERPCISLHCEDAAHPASWSAEVLASIQRSSADDSERWVLALDTAYHFSPSRWPLVKHAHTQLHASFMAFDLCLSPTASRTQKFVLRVLTMLMGAPWANFGTPDRYRRQLVEAGYSNDAIRVLDVSEHVFGPLAQYMNEQDDRLKTLGFGIGSFSVAKSLFSWWGRSGVVRGIVVVARR
jgi:hypothetical protein